MRKTFFTLYTLLAALVSSATAQKHDSPLDQYLDESLTIVVGRCLSVGPVNILLRATVELEVFHVVKGSEISKKITVDSQYGMVVGKFYLLRSRNAETGKPFSFRTDSRDSVIPILSADEAEKLRHLPARIVVLRTMNLRIDELESEIRTRQFELEALKNARKEI